MVFLAWVHYSSHLQNRDGVLLRVGWGGAARKRKKTFQSSWNSTQQEVDSNLSGGGGGGKVERGTVGGSF